MQTICNAYFRNRFEEFFCLGDSWGLDIMFSNHHYRLNGLWKSEGKNCSRGLEDKGGLWSYAFSFRSIWTLSGSFPMVIFAFSNTGKHPTFILVYAPTWQLDFV